MNVGPFVEQVKAALAAVAVLGEDATRATAEALIAAAEPAFRLALLNAVAAAADEITVALLDLPEPPAIGVRLDAEDVRIEVRAAQRVAAPVDVPDDDATARVSLRLPEAVKAQVDAAARRDGVSVNSWLGRAAQLALSSGATPHDQPGGRGRSAQRLSGWLNG